MAKRGNMVFDVQAVDDVHCSLSRARGETAGLIDLQFDADMEAVIQNVSDEDLLEYCVKRLMTSEILDKIGRKECLEHFGVDEEE
jgi:hypothetical protein